MTLEEQFPVFGQALQRHHAGDLEGARALYQQLVERPALTARCLQQLGVLARQRGEKLVAANLFKHSLRLEPSNLSVYVDLANALQVLGHTDAALGVLLDQGAVLQTMERYSDAELPYREILALDPLNYGAYVNLGTCLAQTYRNAEAVHCIFKALYLYGRLDKQVADFATELGAQIADRIAVPDANTLPPGKPTGSIEKIEDVLTTLGKLMSENTCLREAVQCHRQSIRMAAGFALAHWNLSLALLSIGNYDEGWCEYEWRWQWRGFPHAQRKLPVRTWQGEPLTGKRVYVWAEQGFGDAMQFCHLVARLAMAGANVTFEVPTPLVRLMRASLENVTVVDAAQAQSAPFDVDAFDFAVPHISLPALLKLKVNDLPLACGYLQASHDAVVQWASRLPMTDKLRVGLVWDGRKRPDPRRSIAFAQLGPLLARRTVTWFSLQVGQAQQDIPAAGNAAIENLAPYLTDFAETAAAITNLDLVVTIDSAVAHLAAGLAKPVWLLLPKVADWRWQSAVGASRWYPTLRVFQQNEDGQWDSVIAAVCDALDTHERN